MCMCLCVCVCMYVCMCLCVCVCVYVFVCMCLCVGVYMYVFVCSSLILGQENQPWAMNLLTVFSLITPTRTILYHLSLSITSVKKYVLPYSFCNVDFHWMSRHCKVLSLHHIQFIASHRSHSTHFSPYNACRTSFHLHAEPHLFRVSLPG